MSSLAYTYARALKNSFEKKEDFFSFVEEVTKVTTALSSKEIKPFFLSPVIPSKEKKDFLRKALNSFDFNPLTSSFLFLLIDKRRLKELKAILNYLLKMVDEIKEVMSVEVESKQKLSLDLKEKLIKKLSQFFNKQVLLKEVTPSKNLIGGVKLRAGGFVFDDTILLHLNQLENHIRREAYGYTSK